MTKSRIIDRKFTGVGRIARASGTDNAATFKRINAMLTGLSTIGRLDVLAGIRDGVWTALEVLYLYERGQLDKLPKQDTAAGLLDAFTAFVVGHEAGASYRADMETSGRHLAKAIGGRRVTVADLPTMLRGMKDAFKTRPVAFNRLRAHCLAFAGEVQGEMSPLWIEVKRVRRFKKAEGQRPRKLQRRPLTVAELDQVCAAFVDHEYRRGANKTKGLIAAINLADMTRVLALTGMRPQEYWMRDGATWNSEVTYIQVNGTKTAAAKRPTFALVHPWQPRCGEQFFRARFAEATAKALGVALDAYSLRRTFASLMEGAKLEPSRARAYLGHGPKTVTDIYLQTVVLPFVQQDAALVADWIAAERKRAAARPTLTLETGA